MPRCLFPLALLGFVFALAPARSAEPHAPKLTTPKDHFGFNLGDDYCLANYKQYAAYLAKLEKESDRIKVVNIGDTDEKRPQLMAIVTSPANHKKLDQYRDIARKLATAEGCQPEEAAQARRRGQGGRLDRRRAARQRGALRPGAGRDDLPVPQRHGRRDAAHPRRRDHPLRPRQPGRHGPLSPTGTCASAIPKKRSLAGSAAALPEVHRPRQQPRLLRQHAGRDEEHEPRDVPRVVPADRLQPPPDRPAGHRALLPAVSRSRSTTTSIRW